MRLAHVGEEVWCGDFEACDARADLFDLWVHVWRGRDRDDGQRCRQVETNSVRGLAVRWSEGQGISDLSVPMDEIAEYMARPGRLLIHCKGGVCRSTALAIVAQALRGRPFWDAIGGVYRGIWRAYRCAYWPEASTMQTVLEWAEARGLLK